MTDDGAQATIVNVAGKVITVIHVTTRDTGASLIDSIAEKCASRDDPTRLFWRLIADGKEILDSSMMVDVVSLHGSNLVITLVTTTPCIVDRCIEAILDSPISFREHRLKCEDLEKLCSATHHILLSQPMLLTLQAPIIICGDLFGSYADLLQVFKLAGTPAEKQFLFLGDYVDKGSRNVSTVSLLFAYKVKFAESLHLLRGNHENAAMTRIYGFYDECKRLYNVKLWKKYCEVFNCLPICGIVNSEIFCVHGGLSPDLLTWSQISSLQPPLIVPESGLVSDLLWSDFNPESNGWAESNRGVSFAFGPDVVNNFMSTA